MQLEAVCSIPIDEYLLTRIAFTPDGRHILIGHRSPALYGILSGRPLRTYSFDGFLGSPAFSSDGRFMALVNDGDNHPGTPGLARIFACDGGEQVLEIKTEFPIACCCFSEIGGETLFLYRDAVRDESGGVHYLRNVLRGCRVPSGAPALELDLAGWEIRAMASHRDRLTVFGLDALPRTRTVENAGLSYRSFKAGTFSLPAGEATGVCELGTGVGMACFSPSGRLLAAEVVSFRDRERRLIVIDAAQCSIRTLATIEADVVPALSFSEDERFLVYLSEDASGGNSLRLWETNGFTLAGQAPFGPQYHAVAIHSATSRIAALGGGRCDIGLFALESL